MVKNSKILIIAIVALLVAGGFYYQSEIRQAVAKEFFVRASYYFSTAAYDLNKAEKWYKLALTISPNLSNAHYQLGRIYFIKNDFNKALSEINTELSLNPQNQRSYYIRGLINGYRGNYSEAVNDFQKFIAWSPKEWASHNDLAWVYYEAGDYQKAKEVLSRALEIFPGNAWLLNGLVVNLSQSGNSLEAQQILEKAKTYSEKLTESDWQNAYPGNDPTLASQNLNQFKSNLGVVFTPACSSATYHVCDGLNCVGVICDPDHETCSNECSNDCDCGFKTDIKANNSDGPVTLEQYASYRLTWDSCQHDCEASGAWSGDKPPEGSQNFSDVVKGNYKYKLDCPSGDHSSDSVTVNVLKVPHCSFTANPTSIILPQFSTLSWDCRYPGKADSSADTCSIDQGIGSVNNINGSTQVRPANTTTFTLTCSAVDGSRSYEATVNIGFRPWWREILPFF